MDDASSVKSIAELIVKTVVCLAGLLPPITASIIVLRKKDCATEINVIWYAFSVIFVLWWCVHFAVYLNLLRLPPDTQTLAEVRQATRPLPPRTADPEIRTPEERRKFEEERRAEEEKRDAALHELHRRLEEGSPWTGRWFIFHARKFLTDSKSELGIVATILIATILPQLLNYVLAGLSGCAATPRLVWQFEKIAIWSLIKFLAAFGGISVADALGIYAIGSDGGLELEEYLDDVLWGVGAVGLAFIVALLQVYTLEAAHALEDAWPQKPTSWPYRLHRFFTRYLPREENKPGEEAKPTTFDAREIWDKLTPDQQQEIGTLLVRSLFDGRLTAKAPSPRSWEAL
jgi:hypothetical protein